MINCQPGRKLVEELKRTKTAKKMQKREKEKMRDLGLLVTSVIQHRAPIKEKEGWKIAVKVLIVLSPISRSRRRPRGVK